MGKEGLSMSQSSKNFEINTQRAVLDYPYPLDHRQMMRYIDIMIERYPFLSVSYIGESILGRGIPILALGEGEKSVLYVGAHHGMEWITSILLLRFINEYCELYKNNCKAFHLRLNYLFSSRTIYVVPMLNPDGVDYQINGVDNSHILYDRLLAMNGGSNDFSRWQANARGVDLNHNYNAGFAEYKKIEAELGILGGSPGKFSGEMPESEPEVGCLCNYIRYCQNLRMIMSFHTQGEEIYYTGCNRTAPRSRSIAEALSRISGYSLGIPEGGASYGGLTDWAIGALNLPSFTVECGKGENPLPPRDYFYIYTAIREMLFTAPTMI